MNTFSNKYLLSLLIVLLSFYFFTGNLYRMLLPYLGVGWAYVVEQISPSVIALFVGIIVLRKKFTLVRKVIYAHKKGVFLLILIGTLAHSLILNYYFFAEDVHSILSPVNNNNSDFPFGRIITGYPFSPFVLSFLLFGTKSLYYNIFSMFAFLAVGILFYCFINIMTKNRSFSLIASLFFVTTPSFLDMFSWQASAQGMPFVLGLSLLSMIFLVYYQKCKQYTYYLLSLIFFAASIQMGFVRTAWVLIVIILLVLLRPCEYLALPWARMKQVRKKPIRRGGLHPSMGGEASFFAKKQSTSGFIHRGNITEGLFYIAIFLGFVWIRGLRLFTSTFEDLSQTAAINVASYVSSISYYTTHLVIPTELARYVLPLTQAVMTKLAGATSTSNILLFGEIILSFLGLMGLISLKRKNSKAWRIILLGIVLISANLFYLPFFSTSAIKDVSRFDYYFILNIPPYGPGSRYVFTAALGVAILFAIAMNWFLQRRMFLKKIGIAILLIIIGTNVLISNKGHRKIVEAISIPDRIFFEQFFALVPRNDEPKLVFSVNPAKNAIDSNVGGGSWLYGFYKRHELEYTNDKDRLYELVRKGQYHKENIFAFYTNPETNSFADVSQNLRESLEWDGEKLTDWNVSPLSFSKVVPGQYLKIPTQDGEAIIYQRSIIQADDLDKRILFPKSLKLVMLSNLLPRNIPYSDVLISEHYKGIPQLVGMLNRNYPAVISAGGNFPNSITSLLSFGGRQIKDIPLGERLRIAEVIRERDYLRSLIVVHASDKDLSDERVDEQSLVDGKYTSDPKPTVDQKFFLAQTTPTAIELELPYTVVLGRVLLNTSKSYTTTRSPVVVEILTSLNGNNYVRANIVKYSDDIPSPNGGRLLTVEVQPTLARHVRINILETGGEPVMLDEVVIDTQKSLAFTPEQIDEYEKKAFWQMDDESLFNQLIKLHIYNVLPVFWACAEDADWQKQKENPDRIVPGVWHLGELKLTPGMEIDSLNLQIDCWGSLLRKIIIIGPPYPVEIGVKDATIE